MKYQSCLYCENKINRYSLYHLLIEEDSLCIDCRKKLDVKRRKAKIDNLTIEYFYNYDSLFKSILLQYKECYDEALSIVFLYKIDLYIKLRYWNYEVVYIPSTKKKLEERGFNHLELIFDRLGFKKVQGLEMKEDIRQVGKNAKDRKKMLDNYLYKGSNLKNVLIVDDVCTSGSSIIGVLNALKGHYKKAKVLVLSKA